MGHANPALVGVEQLGPASLNRGLGTARMSGESRSSLTAFQRLGEQVGEPSPLFRSQARDEADEAVGVRLILVFSATRSATNGRARRNFLIRWRPRRVSVRIPKLDVRGSNPLARSFRHGCREGKCRVIVTRGLRSASRREFDDDCAAFQI
jgi:hypothetical protein